MSLVSLVKVRNNDFREAIENALDLINYRLKNGIRNIVIKPNLCYYWDYSTGQTTDPRFVGALIEVIRSVVSSKTKIAIVESDASAMKCKYAFKFLGYEKLAKKYDVDLVNLSQDECDAVEVTVGTKPLRFVVPRRIRESDLKINLPKIKYTVERLKLTCALKNIYGCNPYPKKYQYHSRIEDTIVALNKAMKFDLCIIDGNIVSGANPRKLGLVMASEDLVAIDVAAAKIAGLNLKAIKYLKLANREGLGKLDFIPKGLPLDYFRARYPCKGVRKKLFGQAYELVVMMQLEKKLGLS